MRIRSALAFATGCLAAALVWASVHASGPVLSRRVPGAGIDQLTLDAGDGSVVIEKGTTDDIAISAVVEAGRADHPWWSVTGRRGDPSAAVLKTDVAGGRLSIAVDPRGGDPLEVRWRIAVAPRLGVRVSGRKSEIQVSGVEGGVWARADSAPGGRHGRIEVDVPRGPLDLRLGVGRIDARTRTASYSDVDIRSTVGDAQLSIDQHEIDAPREPGPGHRLGLRGSGRDPLTVRVTVGDARLQIR